MSGTVLDSHDTKAHEMWFLIFLSNRSCMVSTTIEVSQDTRQHGHLILLMLKNGLQLAFA